MADKSSESKIETSSPFPTHVDDTDMHNGVEGRTRNSSETNYDVVDINTSSPPSPSSQDPADTLICSSQHHLDLPEEALLASLKLSRKSSPSPLPLRGIAIPVTITVLVDFDRFIFRFHQCKENDRAMSLRRDDAQIILHHRSERRAN
ncbi:hypothetical protein Aduo_019306 [Ancylostoma duodenale]